MDFVSLRLAAYAATVEDGQYIIDVLHL